jgi:hypothetical protein
VNALGNLGVRARLLNSRTEIGVSQRDASACCRMRHRQLAGQGRNRGRLASCAAADHRRWTGWRFLRNHRFSLLVKILPLVIEGGRGFRRRGLYQAAKASLLILGERAKPHGAVTAVPLAFLGGAAGTHFTAPDLGEICGAGSKATRTSLCYDHLVHLRARMAQST